MYVLVVRDPEGNETEYDLVGEAVLGRDESADVQLPNPGVSRRHARVFLEDGLCYVEDLGSANGTLLEGEAVVGQVVLEPGRAVSLGPFELWVEEPEGAEEHHQPVEGSTGRWEAPPAASGRPLLGTLEGISGTALGQIFELRAGSVIGRLPGVDIVVDDPSMSRKHAEVHLAEGEVVLRDLDSANGTFVNEMPIIEQALEDGDIVTFGSVAFRFDPAAGLAALAPAQRSSAPVGGVPVRGGRSKKSSSSASSRRRVLMLAVVGVLALGMVVIVVGGRDPGPQQPGVPGASKITDDDLRTEVFNLMRRGQMMMDAERWEQAEDVFARVVELDPINAEARNNLQQARLEVEMQKVFEEGNRLAQLGGLRDLEDALEAYMRVDAESSYRRRSRFQVHQIVERLQRMNNERCRGHVTANRFEEALAFCRRYMDFACQCPETIDDRVRQALRRAERVERVPQRERWSCPSGLDEWMPCATRISISEERDPSQLIQRKYENERIAGAVEHYYRGRVDDAIRELGRIVDGRGIDGDVRERARTLRRDLRIAQGTFQRGQTDLMRGDLDQAHEAWTEVIEVDRRVLPGDLQSSMRREAVRRLSSAYHERGFELQRMRRYPEAFSWYQRGHSINPDDTRIGEGIAFLERAAFHHMRQAQTCGDLRRILNYTVDEPPSPAHQQVQQAMSSRNCPR